MSNFLLNKLYTEGIKKIAYASNFYQRKIKENLQNYSQLENDNHINNQIETYLHKELRLALKNNRNYFTDMYNLKIKDFKLIPDTSIENFYISKETGKPEVNLVKTFKGTQNYLVDPYSKHKTRLIHKHYRETKRTEEQIGSLTEKFLMEGKIERPFVPAVFKPDVFNF